MTRTLRPALTLMLLSPLLPELLTTNTTLTAFLNPGTFLFLVLLGYGLPVLVIREIAVRYRLGLTGIVALGAVYGIYGEGLFAKTLILRQGLPIPAFDDYGYVLGVSLPWTFAISLWHACAAVLFPILFTHTLFPGQREVSWLDRKSPAVLALILLAVASLSFFGVHNVPGTATPFLVLLILMTACAATAACFSGIGYEQGASRHRTLKPLLLGLSTVCFLTVTSVAAGCKVPILLFGVCAGLIPWLYRRILKRSGWLSASHLTLFGIGFYLQTALVGMGIRWFGSKTARVETLTTGLLAIALLLGLALRIRERGFNPTRQLFDV